MNRNLLILSALLLFPSCEKVTFSSLRGKTNLILPTVCAQKPSVKSGMSTTGRTVVCDGFSIVETVGDMDDLLHAGTKTTMASVSDLQSSGFDMDAWAGDENIIASSDGTANVTYSSDWSISGEPKWRNGLSTFFWSWYPASLDNGTRTISSVTEGSNSRTFTYTLPAHQDGEDAEIQCDLLFAYNCEKREFDENDNVTGGEGTTSDGTMNMIFRHALCAVRFTTGSLQDGYSISKVQINNVYPSTTCTMTGGAGDSNGGSITFDHTPSGTLTSYSQDYTSNPSADSEYIFFLIPQTLNSNTSITWTITDGTVSTTRTATLNGSTTWEAGKYYNYQIGSAAVEKTVTYTFTSTDWTGFTRTGWTDDTHSWSSDAGTGSSYSASTGISKTVSFSFSGGKFGAKSTTDFTNVRSISIVGGSGSRSVTPTVSVTVGGTSVGSTTVSANNTSQTFTWASSPLPLTGAVSFQMSYSSFTLNFTMYIKSITITYVPDSLSASKL